MKKLIALLLILGLGMFTVGNMVGCGPKEDVKPPVKVDPPKTPVVPSTDPGKKPADPAKPEGDKPEGDKPEGDKPEGDKPEGDKPEGDKPVDPAKDPADGEVPKTN